jgi:hypothetical protein
MNKGLGKKAQARGHKRHAKMIAKKKKHVSNLEYIVKLMKKYGKDLKLNESPAAGTKYIEEYLRPTQKEEHVQESN